MRPDPATELLPAAFAGAEGFAAPAHLPRGTRVVAAMSGGVDSAVAAALLQGAGYDVVGVSMRLGSSATRADGHSGCCSLDDFDDARRCAERLGLPHYVVDFRETFARSVVAPFAAGARYSITGWLRGERP